MIDITILGSGGGMPMPERFLSSFIISYKGRKILVDCGEGTQVAMKVNSTGFKAIDIIVITHGHGDHINGLPGLLGTIGNSDRTEPLTIIGPYGIKALVAGLRVTAAYLPYEINIIEDPWEDIFVNLYEGILVPLTKRQGKKAKTGEITISTLGLNHSAPCLGYSFYIKRNPLFSKEKAEANEVPKELWSRLQKGEELCYEGRLYKPSMVLGEERKGLKLSFITDSRPSKAIESFISNADLFVCEGNYGDDEDIEKAVANKHMTFREAATMASNASVKKLLLTHFSPALTEPEKYVDNATSVFKDTMLAKDGLSLTLSFKE